MVNRNWLVGLVLLVAAPAALADIGPPRIREDVINFRLYTAKEFPDYIIYA
jgi:hypothetical protein